MSDSLGPHGLQHTRLPCPSLSPRACSNSCPLSRRYPPTISSSLIPFSCPQSCPASESFPMNWLFTSGGQSIGASASVLPINIRGLFPLEFTVLISLQSKGLSRVFSNTTVQKHQFLGAQLSLWSSSTGLFGGTDGYESFCVPGKHPVQLLQRSLHGQRAVRALSVLQGAAPLDTSKEMTLNLYQPQTGKSE